MLTGLLIGFCIGAGFGVFENFIYASDTYSVFLIDEGDILLANISSMYILVVRTFWGFFSGHHYWTAIFGAMYVLFKKHTEIYLSDIFQWRVIVGYIVPVVLHMSWNASTFIESYFISLLVQVLICTISVLSLIFLINIGINQTRVMGIYESYQISTHGEYSSASNEEV